MCDLNPLTHLALPFATFREEGLGLGTGPAVGDQKSRLETRGGQFSGALNRQLMACISSLTLTIEIMELTEVHVQVRYMSQNYPLSVKISSGGSNGICVCNLTSSLRCLSVQW